MSRPVKGDSLDAKIRSLDHSQWTNVGFDAGVQAEQDVRPVIRCSRFRNREPVALTAGRFFDHCAAFAAEI